MDQFLERLIPLCHSFFPLLAEFPSGVWMLAMSTYLSWLLRPSKREPKAGHPLLFKWAPVAYVGGANLLS